MLNRRKIYVLSAGNMKTGLMGTIMRSSNSSRKKKPGKGRNIHLNNQYIELPAGSLQIHPGSSRAAAGFLRLLNCYYLVTPMT